MDVFSHEALHQAGTPVLRNRRPLGCVVSTQHGQPVQSQLGRPSIPPIPRGKFCVKSNDSQGAKSPSLRAQIAPAPIDGPLDAASAAERIRAARKQGTKVFSISLGLTRFDGATLRDHDHARGARVQAICVSWPAPTPPVAEVALASQAQPQGVSFELQSAEDLMVLEELWTGTSPLPYIVFLRAQRALSALSAAGLKMPTRLGCVTTAATLLAAGADSMRDERPLDLLALEWLNTELPPVLSAPALLKVESQLLFGLMRALTVELRAQKMTSIFEAECALVPAVVDMESAGMPVDAARLERVGSDWERELGQDPPPPPKRRKRLEKLISTYRYWSRDFVDVDARIRCHLNPLATDSGRFSCSEPNLQQVPSEHTAPGMRACFRPGPGYQFVIADYAQIELRVAAQLAPCEALRELFRQGKDVHLATASTLSGKAPGKVSAHERQLAKAVNFGFLFGMGAKRFSEYAQRSFGLELDQRAAEHARAAFFETFPGISAWHRRIGALSRGGPPRPIEVRTVMGRSKRFEAGAFSFNSALNIPVQGTAAEGFKLAMSALYRALPALGARGVLVVHDEYIAEVPEANGEAARVLIAEIMEREMAKVLPDVPVIAEASLASSWAEK